MTTFYRQTARCSVCGKENEFTGIASTNEFGSPDLDTRPAEMRRSTIFAWVQRCPDCGYCASDVSKARPGSEAVVSGEEYKEQLNDPAYPELANSFLCQAIIHREAGDYAAATWALIHAAWACDDEDRPDQAVACRGKAADMLLRAKEHRQQVAKPSGASAAILVDLLRRAHRLDEAARVLERQEFVVTSEVLERVLKFQAFLVDIGDVACHTIAEAYGRKE